VTANANSIVSAFAFDSGEALEFWLIRFNAGMIRLQERDPTRDAHCVSQLREAS